MIWSEIILRNFSSKLTEDAGEAFSLRNQFICDFIMRTLKPSKHLDFKALSIDTYDSCDNSCFLRYKELVVTLRCDINEYQAKKDVSLYEFYARFLKDGASLATRERPLPLSQILEALRVIRDNKWRNSWIHASKRLRTKELVQIECSLDEGEFKMKLRLIEEGQTTFEQVITTVKPYWLYYQHLLGRIVVDGERVILKDRSSHIQEPVFVFHLKERKFEDKHPSNAETGDMVEEVFDSKLEKWVRYTK